MKSAFKHIPWPLQKQILYRLGLGAAVLLITAALLFSHMDLFSVLSCAGILLFCCVSAFFLFRRAVIGDYVVIRGKCLSVALTAVRKRTKMIVLKTEENHTLQVMIKQRLKKIRAGAQVTLYVAASMPVYEKEQAHLLHSYLAIETKGGDRDE